MPKNVLLSINDSRYELPHRVGLHGLAKLLLSQEVKLKLNSHNIEYVVSPTDIAFQYYCSDREFFCLLQEHAYHLDTESGLMSVPFLNMTDDQKYYFTNGIVSSYLQHTAYRSFNPDKTQVKQVHFAVESSQGTITLKRQFRPLQATYLTSPVKDLFDKKGNFKKALALKSNHIPGLSEDKNSYGTYETDITEWLPIFFLPIATPVYQLPYNEIDGNTVALTFKDCADLINQPMVRQYEYLDFYQASPGAIAFNLEYQLERKYLDQRIEIFILGKQSWNGQQNFLKKEVVRYAPMKFDFDLYDLVLTNLPPYFGESSKDSDENTDIYYVSWSKMFRAISNNLAKGLKWDYKLDPNILRNDIYKFSKLLPIMEFTSPQIVLDYREFITAVFRKHLHKQYKKYDGMPDDKVKTIKHATLQSKQTHWCYQFAQATNEELFRDTLITFIRTGVGNRIGDIHLPRFADWINSNWKDAHWETNVAIMGYAPKTTKSTDTTNTTNTEEE